MNEAEDRKLSRHIVGLLVEDDAVDRMACRRALQKHPDYDFELYEADTGQEGLKLAREHKFDCILLDYHLPDMTGLDFLAEIADEMGNIHVPVLKLTGSDNIAIAVEAMKRGARDYLIKDSEGRYLELLPAVIQRVLSGQRLLEEKRSAEERYRRLVEHLPSITYILSFEEEGRLIFVSPQIERLGFVVEEWLERRDLRFQQIHAEDRDAVMQSYLHSRNTGESFRCDYRMLTRAGETRWFHDEASVVRDETGNMMYLQGVMLDITEKKAMEEELAEHRYRLEQRVSRMTELLERRISVLESANAQLCRTLESYEAERHVAKIENMRTKFLQEMTSDAVLDVDPQGIVTGLNPAAEKLLGVDAEEAAGVDATQLLKFEGKMGLEDLLAEALIRNVHPVDATLSTEGGEKFRVESRFARVPNPDGKHSNFLILLHLLPEDAA